MFVDILDSIGMIMVLCKICCHKCLHVIYRIFAMQITNPFVQLFIGHGYKFLANSEICGANGKNA